GEHVANEVIKLMIQRDIAVAGSRILILGMAFKENCPDLRNTRVVELAQRFREYRAQVDIHDPWVDPATARHEYGVELLTEQPQQGRYDAVVLAVAHEQYRELGAGGARRFGRPGALLYDIKSLYPRDQVDARL
ncbi:MAG TPA: UDP binding domain-containing protein, partial [Lysobacter sp.]